MDLEDLSRGSRIAPAVLGHRGSRLVVDVSETVTWTTDERTDLPFCPVGSVFASDAVFLGFGTPNVFLMVPETDGDRWSKFTAFMFWRQKSYVAQHMDRMQVGVYFEMRGLSQEALAALRTAMNAHRDRRTPSCANANARVLSAAGFTSGGRSIAHLYRPSQLAAELWERGLEYDGKPVEIRIVQAGSEVGDHFVGVWMKEFTAACRTVRKLLAKHKAHGAAPQFEAVERVGMSTERWLENTDMVTIGISRPSWLGVWFGFLLGQRPIFSLMLESPLGRPELNQTLKRFPGKLNTVTKFKKYVLFSKPVVRFLRARLVKSVDEHRVPRRAVVEMLRHSPGPEQDGAFVYNLVLTPDAVHMARLENRNGRDRRFVNWVLAKHLVVGGHDADARFAGENWCFEEDGRIVVVLNRNSGTYKPRADQLRAAAALISEFLDVEVRIMER